jgi:hypothetical protein
MGVEVADDGEGGWKGRDGWEECGDRGDHCAWVFEVFEERCWTLRFMGYLGSGNVLPDDHTCIKLTWERTFKMALAALGYAVDTA